MKKPTLAYVHLVLDYDPATGALTWKPRPREMFATLRAFVVWNKRFAAKPAFTCQARNNQNKRYGRSLVGTLYGKRYYAHSLIFFWMTGRWPIEVDHENGNRFDNSWGNLKEATRLRSQHNVRRALTHKGKPLLFPHVGIERRGKGFGAYIGFKRKRIRRGPFDTVEEAIEVRQAMERKYGFSLRHGR